MITLTPAALAYVVKHKRTRPYIIMEIRYKPGCPCCFSGEKPYVRVRQVGGTNRLQEFVRISSEQNLSMLAEKRIFDLVGLVNENVVIDAIKIRTHHGPYEKLTSNIILKI